MVNLLNCRGPLIQAVVWNNGEKWLTALDTSDLIRFHCRAPDTCCGLERRREVADRAGHV